MSYSGVFLLERSAARMLRIQTLRSRLDLPFLPVSEEELLRVAAKGSALFVELRSGLPPWAQPQFDGLVVRDAGGYRMDAQLLIPLSAAQLAQTESVLGGPFYRGNPLYLADSPAFYRLPILRIGAQAMFPSGARPAIPEFSGLSGFLGGTDFLRSFPALLSQFSSLSPSAEPEIPVPPLAFWLGSLGRRASGARSKKPDLNTEENIIPNRTVGSFPLLALFGGRLAKNIENVLPGASQSYLRLRSSALSNWKDFGFWLDELQIDGGNERKLLLRGSANAEQLSFKKLALRWDSLALDNRFVWNIADESGAGQLVLQGRDLRYELKRLELPNIKPAFVKGKQRVSASAKRAWLLWGDYELYAYLDEKRYQIAFERLPLPTLSTLPFFGGEQMNAQNATQNPTNNFPESQDLAANLSDVPNFLSANISGVYPKNAKANMQGNNQGNTTIKNSLQTNATQALVTSAANVATQSFSHRRSWKLNIEKLHLDIAEQNPYFPSGSQLRLAGTWEPGQLHLRQLTWEEPQRLLTGEAVLYWIRPQLPLPIIPSVSLTLSQASDLSQGPVASSHRKGRTLHKGRTLRKGRSVRNSRAQRLGHAVVSAATFPVGVSPQFSGLLVAEAPVASLFSVPFPVDAQNDEKNLGYWLGRIQLRGQRTEVEQREGGFLGSESLDIEFSSERQGFRASGRGQLDVTRFSQVLGTTRMSGATEVFDATQMLPSSQNSGSALAKGISTRQKGRLESGSLRFEIEAGGMFRAPKWLRPTPGLYPESPESSGGYLRLAELSGSWELAEARYDGIDLSLGSKILWQPKTGGTAWLFSDVQGQFGRLRVERSFFSLRETLGDWNVSGLLNYIMNIRRDRDYRSSIALELSRSRRPRLLLPSERFALRLTSQKYESPQNAMQQELLRWQGSLYSYPLRAYTQIEATQATGSISALANNLRDNVFNAGIRQSVSQVYPGFELFLTPQIATKRQTGPQKSLSEQSPIDTNKTNRVASPNTAAQVAELRLHRFNPEDFELGIQSGGFYWNMGAAFPVSFRARGNWGNLGNQSIDVRLDRLRVEPSLLNDLLPEDPIMQRPVLRLVGGAMQGSLRLSGRALNPAMDGVIKLQDISLYSPYFPDESPLINAELIFQGHIIMARPFRVAFRKGQLYSLGYEAAYLRHESLRIQRYYLGFRAKGRISVFYDAYGIRYRANALGEAVLQGNAQGGSLRADLEFERLLMQGSEIYRQLPPGNTADYPFSLDIRAKTGRSARLAYPSEASPIFNAQLNPRDQLRFSYDGKSKQGNLEGRIELYNGKLYLLGNQMELHKGELNFAENFSGFSPQISLFFTLPTYDAEGQNIQINMDYKGDLANLAERDWAPTLSSQPPLPQQQLRYLLAAQFNAGGNTEGTTNLNRPQNQLFSSVLSHLGSRVVLKPIEELIRKGFQFDEVRLETSLIGNLLRDYLNSGPIMRTSTLNAKSWLQYLDNTRLSVGSYIDRNNTILFSLNIDLLYKPQDTRPVLFVRDGLQIVPGFGFKFHTPLLDISLDVGLAHYNDFFITDSSLLLEWSLSTFLKRRRLGASQTTQIFEPEIGVLDDEPVHYNEE